MLGGTLEPPRHIHWRYIKSPLVQGIRQSPIQLRTNLAQCCLTSVISQELAHSVWYQMYNGGILRAPLMYGGILEPPRHIKSPLVHIYVYWRHRVPYIHWRCIKSPHTYTGGVLRAPYTSGGAPLTGLVLSIIVYEG